MIVLLEGGVTIDTAVALGLITAAVGGLVGAISILYKALNSAYERNYKALVDAYERQISDLRADRDHAYELADQSARQLGRSADVADRTISLAEKRSPR